MNINKWNAISKRIKGDEGFINSFEREKIGSNGSANKLLKEGQLNNHKALKGLLETLVSK